MKNLRYPAILSMVTLCVASSLESAIPLQQRLQSVAQFIKSSYKANGTTSGEPILQSLPTGQTHSGHSRLDLKYTYWLQNNALYSAVALKPYFPSKARQIENSYYYWYDEVFSTIDDDAQHLLVIGIYPSPSPPPVGYYYRSLVAEVVVQPPRSSSENTEIVVGTEYHDGSLGRIHNNDPRLLLKYGVLQNVLAGKISRAKSDFRKALDLWDGKGFLHPKMANHNAYYARDLALALICDKALPGVMSNGLRGQIRSKIWNACWDSATGGVWTNYYANGSQPGFAKMTNEIAPLVLLAYDNSVW